MGGILARPRARGNKILRGFFTAAVGAPPARTYVAKNLSGLSN
jgi:hypothetical protein